MCVAIPTAQNIVQIYEKRIIISNFAIEKMNKLSAQYNLGEHEPNIQVYNVDLRGDRTLTLRYYANNRIPLADSAQEVMKHLHHIWKFDVVLEQENPDGQVLPIATTKKTASV
jgi:spore cortex formation protein SpoVR/YcgB (stage V sporulation)